MAENQDGQEKSEQPSSKRLEDARKKGQVPRSRELNTFALLLVGSFGLVLMGRPFREGFFRLLHSGLSLSRADLYDDGAMLRHLAAAVHDTLLMLAPFFGLALVTALAASIALGGFNVSTEALQPKFERLDPLKGLKRLVSWKGLLELVKSLVKFLLVAGVAVWLLWLRSDDLVNLGRMEAVSALMALARILGGSLVILSATLVVIAAADVPFQLWDHRRQLRMTKQEVKEERKQSDGNPEVKARIRGLQREMALRRMMAEVPKADVIVTNPTHYAVALRYDPERMRAPRLVAKGSDLVARNIRRLGAEHGVPLVEAPGLARAIYHHTEIGGFIPTGLYMAVARLLAYVFQLEAWRAGEAAHPDRPEFNVPEDLRVD